MPICKLCGREKKLIKAHIIPRKLYNPIREASSGESPRVYGVGTGKKSQQSQSGIYDTDILCGECDGDLIGPWDNYGQTLLLSSPSPENYIVDDAGKPAGYKIDIFDYNKLKLFFMSILWRAAITSDQFFSQVQLGAWEDKLKKMILAKYPGSENDFSVVLFKYEGDGSEITPNSTKHKLDGVNYYRFRIPKYGFLIKVDKRNFPPKLAPYILSSNPPLLISVMEYMDSKESEVIWAVRHKISD
jgi:hypothetical protein